MKIHTLASLVTLLTFNAALSAETLLEYTFENSFAPSTQAENVTGTSIAWGAGLPSSARGFGSSNRNLYARSTIVDQPVSASSNDYVEFTLAAGPGHELNLESLSFRYFFTSGAATDSHTAAFTLRSDADGYANDIASFGQPSATGSNNGVNTFADTGSIGLTAAAYQGLESITFRIFLSDDGVNSNDYTLRMGLFNVQGAAVSTIPEPAAFPALLGLGAIGAACLRRRRA